MILQVSRASIGIGIGIVKNIFDDMKGDFEDPFWKRSWHG